MIKLFITLANEPTGPMSGEYYKAVSIELRQLGLFHKNWLFLLDGNGKLREINIYKRKKRESFVF